MKTHASTWGAIAGTAGALAVLAWLSFMLLNSGGANYKVLVAVWLWLLPATGAGAGIGYAAGKIIEGAVTRASRRHGESHADAR